MRAKILVVITIAIFSLTGCVSSVNMPDEQVVSVSYTGVLEDVPQATSQLFDASHVFQPEDGGLVYVRSLIYDLSDVSYQDALLKVEGLPREVSGKTTLTIDRIEVLELDLNVELEYETYLNQELGISLEVPTILQTGVEGGNVVITGDALGGAFSIARILPEEADLAPNVIASEDFDAVKVGADNLDGYKAKVVEDGYRYVVIRNESLYEFNYRQLDEDVDMIVANELINSLKFIPVKIDELDVDDEEVAGEEEVTDEEPATDEEEEIVESETVDLSSLDLEKYNPLESLPLGFSIYYPNSWYYAQIGNGYAFASDPVTDDNWIAYISVGDADVDLDSSWSKFAKTNSGKQFELYGDNENRKFLETMIQTVQVSN